LLVADGTARTAPRNGNGPIVDGKIGVEKAAGYAHFASMEIPTHANVVGGDIERDARSCTRGATVHVADSSDEPGITERVVCVCGCVPEKDIVPSLSGNLSRDGIGDASTDENEQDGKDGE
jgi:hypothetical protein